MELRQTDPDIETIVGRIEDGSLDLQPEFQRGAVWSRSKQRLLIDSVLRRWYVPPVYLVCLDDGRQEVLDGQQRLTAIFDFAQSQFTIDGSTDPASEDIACLDGMAYDDLPHAVRRRFDRFSLRCLELVDYSPEEPYELFYRLNQPTALTSAEKRNAFFGDPRDQVKRLTAIAEEHGLVHERVGFSNTRFAYEDIVARFVWTLERERLDEKITASRITERYREGTPFDDGVYGRAADVLAQTFGIQAFDDAKIRLNKATAHSWLCFVTRLQTQGRRLKGSDLGDFVHRVEETRLRIRKGSRLRLRRSTRRLYEILNDRATARVNDVSSVLLRDVVLWILASHYDFAKTRTTRQLVDIADRSAAHSELEDHLLNIADASPWGSFT